MKDCRAAYIKQVGQKLDVPYRRRRELLCGLRAELEERFPGETGIDELIVQAGTPAEVAEAILEGVDPEERRRYRGRRILHLRFLAAALAVLLAFSVWAFFYFGMNEVGRAEIIVVTDPVPTQYGMPEN